MVRRKTDSKTITITVVEHADCVIENLVFPTDPIEKGEAFTITYDVTNNGIEENCYGTLEGTIHDWEEVIANGGTVSKTIDFPNGIQEDFTGELHVGSATT